ncbi:unnamed protein product, partial [Symbiodinium necroappetens]
MEFDFDELSECEGEDLAGYASIKEQSGLKKESTDTGDEGTKRSVELREKCERSMLSFEPSQAKELISAAGKLTAMDAMIPFVNRTRVSNVVLLETENPALHSSLQSVGGTGVQSFAAWEFEDSGCFSILSLALQLATDVLAPDLASSSDNKHPECATFSMLPDAYTDWTPFRVQRGHCPSEAGDWGNEGICCKVGFLKVLEGLKIERGSAVFMSLPVLPVGQHHVGYRLVQGKDTLHHRRPIRSARPRPLLASPAPMPTPTRASTSSTTFRVVVPRSEQSHRRKTLQDLSTTGRWDCALGRQHRRHGLHLRGPESLPTAGAQAPSGQADQGLGRSPLQEGHCGLQ